MPLFRCESAWAPSTSTICLRAASRARNDRACPAGRRTRRGAPNALRLRNGALHFSAVSTPARLERNGRATPGAPCENSLLRSTELPRGCTRRSRCHLLRRQLFVLFYAPVDQRFRILAPAGAQQIRRLDL